MNIIEAMQRRRSVRNYNGIPLAKEVYDDLKKIMDESFTFFGGDVTIRLKRFDLKGDLKPGTYGVIKGASDFFLLGIGDDDESALTAGFQFEQVVLRAWQMGLGTCWIAGTFKNSDFNRGEEWPEGESLKVICPVGFHEKPRFLDKVTRLAIGSDKRKPFSDLFFDGNFNTPLSHDSKFSESLTMLRLAPSSTNSQPWRAVVDGDAVHFFCVPKSKISVLDCGIGICHFYETEKFRGQNGKFFKLPDAPAEHDKWKYLVSYSRTDL